MNLLQITVYFETLNVETLTTRSAYTFVALLSDIGGQLGLFLGLSVLSIVEYGNWIIKKIRGQNFSADIKKVKDKCRSCYQNHSESVALDENLIPVESETSINEIA